MNHANVPWFDIEDVKSFEHVGVVVADVVVLDNNFAGMVQIPPLKPNQTERKRDP